MQLIQFLNIAGALQLSCAGAGAGRIIIILMDIYNLHTVSQSIIGMVILVNHFTDFTEPWRWLGAGAQLWLHHGLDPSRGQLHLQVEQGRAVPVLC